jgi:5-methylcytosine-specific restriction endonuclease McrA
MPMCKTCDKKCYGEYCFQHKPRKPLKRTPIKNNPSKRTRQDKRFREIYLDTHANEYGYYECYLKTTEMCPKVLTREQATIEHVIPKGSVKGRNLRFNEDNIRIACFPCNGDKGSQSLENYLKSKEKA